MAGGRLNGNQNGGRSSRSSAGAASRLGNNTKSSTPSQTSPKSKGRLLRVERYRIQSIARKIIRQEGVSARLEFPLNFHRTGKCRHVAVGRVGVHKAHEYDGAFYSGLAVCGSVWACPVCTAKIQERRREEVAQAIDWAYINGKKCVMVTLTFPHTQFDDLATLFAKQSEALKHLRSGNTWTKFKDQIGFEGLIRSLELTIGRNGWHPHTHEIWIVDRGADAEFILQKILERWEKACIKAGLLNPKNLHKVEYFRQHAVDVYDNASTGDYLAKQDDSRHWGADSELVRGSSKQGKHPFSLLPIFDIGIQTDDPLVREAGMQAGKKFAEYIDATKGKRQMFWSHGLKERVGVNDVDDQTLADESRESADLLGFIADTDWRLIRNHEQRAQLLDVAELGGWESVQKFISDLRARTLSDNRVENDFDTLKVQNLISDLNLEPFSIDLLTGELVPLTETDLLIFGELDSERFQAPEFDLLD